MTTMQVRVLDENRNDPDFVLSLTDGKQTARALELLYVTQGNSDAVEDIMILETGINGIILRGAISLAEDLYFRRPNVMMDRWRRTEPRITSIPL